MPNSTHPYDALTPDLILDSVESSGLRCDGRLLALNSFENRVRQIRHPCKMAIATQAVTVARTNSAPQRTRRKTVTQLVTPEPPTLKVTPTCGVFFVGARPIGSSTSCL